MMQASTRALPSLRQALAAYSRFAADGPAGALPVACSTSRSLAIRAGSSGSNGTSLIIKDATTTSSSSSSSSCGSSSSASCAPWAFSAPSMRSFASGTQQEASSVQEQRQRLQQQQQKTLTQEQAGQAPGQVHGRPRPSPTNESPVPSDEDDDDDDDLATSQRQRKQAQQQQQQQQQGRQGRQVKQGEEEAEPAGQQFGNPHSGVSMNEIRELGKGFTPGSLSQEELWMSGVEGRIKIWAARQQPELKGKEKDISEQVRSEYLQLLTKHAAGRVLSHQARRQLKLACLAIATYRVLMQVTDGREEDVLHHIEQSMGSLYAPFLMGSLKVSSWFRRLLLGQKPIDMAVQTLKDIAKDMEGACECQVEASGNQGRLLITSCMFYDIMAAENATQLLRFFCCQHNATWLEAYGGQGVKGRLVKCRPRGDDVCEIVVEVPDKGSK